MRVSRYGLGGALDNVFVEQLCRTVEYGEVYLKSYRSQIEAYTGIEAYFRFYNDHRPHSAFRIAAPQPAMEVYRQPIALATKQ